MVFSGHYSTNEDNSGVIRMLWDAPEAWVDGSSISDAVLRCLVTLLSWELDVLEVINTKSVTELKERWLNERAVNFSRACSVRHCVVCKIIFTKDKKVLLLVLVKRKSASVVL
jgi:hypothetical protein